MIHFQNNIALSRLLKTYLLLYLLSADLLQAQAQTIELLDDPLDDTGLYQYEGNPIVYHDKLYLRYRADGWQDALVVLDGKEFLIFDIPPAYQGDNLGYLGSGVLHNDRLYLFLNREGNVSDLAYVSDSNLVVIPDPAGHEGTYTGFQGDAVSFAGKLFVRYKNKAGGFELGILEADSLRNCLKTSAAGEKPGFYCQSKAIFHCIAALRS